MNKLIYKLTLKKEDNIVEIFKDSDNKWVLMNENSIKNIDVITYLNELIDNEGYKVVKGEKIEGN